MQLRAMCCSLFPHAAGGPYRGYTPAGEQLVAVTSPVLWLTVAVLLAQLNDCRGQVLDAVAAEQEKMQKAEAEKLFLDKMALLNKTFLHFIECSLKEMPDADLSPSVRDYLKHVEELDRTYGAAAVTCNGSGSSSKSVVVIGSPEKVAPEKSPAGSGNRKREEPDAGASSAAPLFGASATAAATTAKISFDDSKSSCASGDSEKRGRKRAKRGGPEGADEEVIISNHNTPTSARYAADAGKSAPTQAVAPSAKLPSFLTNSATGTALGASFGSPDASKTERSKGPVCENSEESKNSRNAPFSFGTKVDSKEGSGMTSEAPKFLFGKSSPSKDAEQAGSEKEQPANLASKPGVTPVFSFLKPDTDEKSGGEQEGSRSMPAFKFGAPPATQSEPNNEGEETEYVPPKPEAVIAEEPNAIFSSKCSVFVLKGKEYEKLGIGQLHIKKGETDNAKKILLIRAATTTGTVWVNSYIDDTMKHTKVDDTKLRISCVTGGGSPATYLIRLPKLADREKVAEELPLEKNSS